MTPICTKCTAPFAPARRRAGYTTCLDCGDKAAVRARNSWCVVQPYGKGAYQFVTSESAPVVVRQTNQKNPR